jgi:hypothetical protein
MIDRLPALFALCALLLAAGCATVHKDVTSLDQLGAGSVLLVGRIELVPALTAEEQQIDMGLDPMGMKDHHLGRAILFLSDRPIYQDHTANVINPALEQTWFIAVPRAQRYMVRGSITMSFAHRAVNRRQVAVDQEELLIPAPVEFDMKAGYRAIYIGTLRLHRDEFHEVTKAEILDHYPEALAEFRARFGADAPLRKALAKPVSAQVALSGAVIAR